MANNGAPYQKAGGGGGSGAYHEIGNGSPTGGGGGASSGGAGMRKRWIMGLGVVGVIAVMFGVYSSGGAGGFAGANRAAASQKTLKKQVDDSGVTTSADGSLKLFDDMSKCLCYSFYVYTLTISMSSL